MLNILIVFLVSGLWHGANWTFVVWGLLHGVLYSRLRGRVARVERRWRTSRRRASRCSRRSRRIAQIALTFTLTCLAWVFFRAASVGDAFTILGKIASDVVATPPHLVEKARGGLDRHPVRRRVGAARPREPARRRTPSASGPLESLLRVRDDHVRVRAAALHAVHLLSILIRR